jgi:hypothetical protein
MSTRWFTCQILGINDNMVSGGCESSSTSGRPKLVCISPPLGLHDLCKNSPVEVCFYTIPDLIFDHPIFIFYFVTVLFIIVWVSLVILWLGRAVHMNEAGSCEVSVQGLG